MPGEQTSNQSASSAVRYDFPNGESVTIDPRKDYHRFQLGKLLERVDPEVFSDTIIGRAQRHCLHAGSAEHIPGERIIELLDKTVGIIPLNSSDRIAYLATQLGCPKNEVIEKIRSSGLVRSLPGILETDYILQSDLSKIPAPAAFRREIHSNYRESVQEIVRGYEDRMKPLKRWPIDRSRIMMRKMGFIDLSSPEAADQSLRYFEQVMNGWHFYGHRSMLEKHGLDPQSFWQAHLSGFVDRKVIKDLAKEAPVPTRFSWYVISDTKKSELYDLVDRIAPLKK